MSDLDRYDVEAMIRDALVNVRHEWRRDLDVLERELSELRRDVRDELGAERVERQNAVEDIAGRLER